MDDIFKTTKEAEDHAAYSVAVFWLKSATMILQRKDKPCKLSKCASTLAQSEMDREIYSRWFQKMSSDSIARTAIHYALAKLYSGQFTSVRSHFQVTSEDRDSRRLCQNLLSRAEEVH